MKYTTLSLSLLLAICFTASKVNAQLHIGISVHFAPPAIPVYEQPPCPTEGYIWIPGYWAYNDDSEGYYWVPGYWEAPPEVGFLWTPGYWGYTGGIYRWNAGYWGPHVGYYGGINYGYGYGGSGYYGGEWSGGRFRYNTAVTRVDRNFIHNTYNNRGDFRNVSSSRVSYNGGPGGVNYRANGNEQAAMRDRHIGYTGAQQQHQQTAMHDRNQFASVNHGRPSNAAVSRSGSYRPNNNAGRPTSNGNRSQQNMNRSQQNGNSSQQNMNRSQQNMNRSQQNGNSSQQNMNRSQQNGNSSQQNGNRSQQNGNRSQQNGNSSQQNGNRSQQNGNRSQPQQHQQAKPQQAQPNGGGEHGGGGEHH